MMISAYLSVIFSKGGPSALPANTYSSPHPLHPMTYHLVSHLTLMKLHFLTHTLRPLGLLPRDKLSLTPLALLVKGKHPQVFYYKFCTIGFFFRMK